VSFYLLMGFTFILLVAPQRFIPALGQVRIALLTAIGAVTVHLVNRFVHRRPLLVLTRELRIIAALAGWAIVTVPFSYWPGGSVDVLVSQYFKNILVFWLIGATVSSVTRLRQVAWGLSLMAIPAAVAAVREYLTGNFFGGRIVGFVSPMATNPNDLALLLNLILPFTIALLTINRKTVIRWGLFAILGLDVLAVILTFSRGGFLTLATILSTYAWAWAQRGGGRWVVVLVVALATVPLLPSTYVDRLGTITSVDADPTGSAQGRWRDTVAALEFVRAHPLVGAGIGLNDLALNDVRGPKWNPVHNVFLEYAVDLGIPGLVLYLLLFVSCAKSAIVVYRRSAGAVGLRELHSLAEAVRKSLLGFAVAALFHPVAYHTVFYYFGALAVALKAALIAEEGPRGTPEVAAEPWAPVKTNS
jgi:putative inorganic carbon (HCO3(-)) transporter